MSKTIWLCLFSPLSRLLWLSLLLTSLAGPARATLMRYLEVEELTRLSTEVFHGQVVSTRVYWDAEHARIYTAVRVQINESFKGAAKRGEIVTVTQLGGELDGMRLDYGGRPVFNVGEAVVLFAKPGRNRDLIVVGLKQGKLRVVGDEAVRDFSGIMLLEQAAEQKAGRAVVSGKAPRVQTRLSLADLRQRVANAR